MRTAPRQRGLVGPPSGLTVRITPRPPSARLVLRGELDLLTVGTLCEALERVEQSCWTRYEVDLEGLAFADCTGARPLVDLARRAEERGGELVVWGPCPRVALVLAHLGLLHAAPHAPRVTPPADGPRGPRSAV